MPLILGREASSRVISLGPQSSSAKDDTDTPSQDSHVSPGDRVVWMGTSSYAEYSTCSASAAFRIPPEISSADACAAYLQGLTALTLTEEAHPVQRGEWVLVLAASGGVGGWLCQVLRAKGVHTIATVGRREKVRVAEEAGAEIVLVEGEDDVLAIVREKTGGEGVAAVFDGVGKDTFDRSLACLKRKGSMVSFGNSSGAVPPFSIL
jgi:NADPH2:quinone reductase